MSFGGYPPGAPLDNELTRAREQELEAKAAAYAQRHPEAEDGEPRPAGLVARLLRALHLRRD